MARQSVNKLLPIKNEYKIEEVKISEMKGGENAYRKLRLARSDARLVGVREKRSKQKAEQAEAKKG